MMTEKQLQTGLIAILFLLSAITMLMLGIQNYRYGLYDLVYSASLLSVLFLGVSIYARFTPEAKYLKQVCLSVSIAALCFIIMTSFENPEEVKHWIYPLGLLSYLALSYKQASSLNLIIAATFGLILLFTSGLLSALSFTASYALFIGLASTYAQLHKKRSRTLVELEIHNTLTKSYNFRHLEDTLKKEVCRSDRTGKPLSLIALEVDYFPQLHEMHGLPQTQDLMARLAETLRAMIRAGDSDYFDGKQTAYLLLPCTPSEGLLVIAERIRRTIEESNWPVVDAITVSLGCTSYSYNHKASNDEPSKENSSNRDSCANKLISDAQIALFEAQKNGHNRVYLHSL